MLFNCSSTLDVGKRVDRWQRWPAKKTDEWRQTVAAELLNSVKCRIMQVSKPVQSFRSSTVFEDYEFTQVVWNAESVKFKKFDLLTTQ